MRLIPIAVMAAGACLAATAGAQPQPQIVRRMPGPPAAPPRITGDEARVPMSFSRAMPVVEVRIGGRGPYRFGIDTGAQGHGRISGALATELGLAVTGEMQAGDGSGRMQTRHRYRADGLTLGGLTFDAVELSELGDPGGRLAGLHGILGLHLFAGHLLTLDYAGRAVTVQRGALPPGAIGYQGAGSILVALEIGGRIVPTQIDTGNSIAPLLLPAATAQALPQTGEPRQIGQARTALSAIAIRDVAINGPVRLGGVTLPIDRVAYPTLGETGNLGSLALSAAVLRIDQANRRIDLRFATPTAR